MDNLKMSAFIIILNYETEQVWCTKKNDEFHPIGGKSERFEDSRDTVLRELSEEIKFDVPLMDVYIKNRLTFIGISHVFAGKYNWIQNFYLLQLSSEEIRNLNMESKDDQLYVVSKELVERSEDLAFTGFRKIHSIKKRTERVYESVDINIG